MKKISAKTLKLTQLAILTAIIAVMAFTPIGYLRVGVISITLIPIPVAVGAMLLGPSSGAILGGIFGLTSFVQCFGLDPFGTTLGQISVFSTLLLCFIPRILAGLSSGYVYKLFNKVDQSKGKIVSYATASLTCPVVNTVLFMTLLVLFFGKTPYIQSLRGGSNILAFMVSMVGINGLVEFAATLVVATAIAKPLDIALKKNNF